MKRSTSNLGNLRGLDLCATSSAVCACGWFDGWASFGPLNTLANPNAKDIFLVKYNMDGDEQWIADVGSNQDDIANGVIADETHVYFTGSFEGSNLGINNAGGGDAESIVNYLVSKGIDKIRLVGNGYGEARPIGDNSTEEGRMKNRRVEFLILNK